MIQIFTRLFQTKTTSSKTNLPPHLIFQLIWKKLDNTKIPHQITQNRKWIRQTKQTHEQDPKPHKSVHNQKAGKISKHKNKASKLKEKLEDEGNVVENKVEEKDCEV